MFLTSANTIIIGQLIQKAWITHCWDIRAVRPHGLYLAATSQSQRGWPDPLAEGIRWVIDEQTSSEVVSNNPQTTPRLLPEFCPPKNIKTPAQTGCCKLFEVVLVVILVNHQTTSLSPRSNASSEDAPRTAGLLPAPSSRSSYPVTDNVAFADHHDRAGRTPGPTR